MPVELFGSQTTVKCLIYLTAMTEGYPLEISKTFQISNTQVIRTLNKLEGADILVGEEMGRATIYSFNENWFLYKELKALLEKVVKSMPIEERKKYFVKRRQARKKGKVKSSYFRSIEKNMS